GPGRRRRGRAGRRTRGRTGSGGGAWDGLAGGGGCRGGFPLSPRGGGGAEGKRPPRSAFPARARGGSPWAGPPRGAPAGPRQGPARRRAIPRARGPRMDVRLLDLDGSVAVQPVLAEQYPTTPLTAWGPRLRLACRHGRFRAFEADLAAALGDAEGPTLTFVGS